MAIHAPRQIFSFTDFAQSRPREQPPGDRIDAQFAEHSYAIAAIQTALNNLRRDDGILKDGVVAESSLSPSLLAHVMAYKTIIDAILKIANAAQNSAAVAISARDQTSQFLARQAPAPRTVLPAATSQNSAVLFSANSAENWSVASWQWAEHMGGPLPAETVAMMGISGDHWSSRFWANQAAQIVSDFTTSPGEDEVTGGHITISDAPPSSPSPGDVWIDTTP